MECNNIHLYSLRRNFIIIYVVMFTTELPAQHMETIDTLNTNWKDTIVFTLPQYRGEATWQVSDDLDTWFNLDESDTDTLMVYADSSFFIRTMIIEGSCEPLFSDTAFVEIYVPEFRSNCDICT